ncbi:hypothetical protein NIES2135_27020 [Leptolyngbya boryana NIES-2135]|jgi:hypothetical protein|uniref:Uncharacterized protein n=1 Tax=Leptolyngbya boryana NIES-2135 TaxID=1973484 RepID=A0A1Z4JH77_LEPBY|nr:MULTISPECIES: hypothetical protein [Leptolyngbya]BAY55877.1 hypothetical protein NIES2135_27020 [Leptolyngbya boryana NIES-2135]MBD2368817.1 hypothetical protein [Leptolyngbya sp. FACHB-161]MBD2375315.1 hypothetical protein [Leptolyngbya sp. FACHB-238]MBD2399733.1 hypothetical protein [Leptolyngbya sp. FACHB-239]MBD2405939.1 hypothetical protein [Leptolyngbya sp. FACHB-402]
MPQEDAPKPIPISQARSKREASPKIETTTDEMRQVIAEVLEQGLAAKITRLEVSINRMMDHIEGVKNGTAEDAALRVTTDSSATDLALAKVTLASEEYYIYTSAELAEKLNVRLHDVQQMGRVLGLKNDNQYHKAVKTGKKTEVQKYSEAALLRMKEALASREYVAVFKEW